MPITPQPTARVRLSDGFTLTDGIILNNFQTVSDSISTADTPMLNVFIPVTDSFSYSDTVLANIFIPLSDGISTSDSRIQNVFMPLSDGISTADSIINTVIVLPVDGISLSESITSQNVFAPLSDTISLTDDPDISLWFSLSESISIDDDVFSIYYKPTLGTVMAGDFSDSLADTIDEDVTLRQVVNTQDSSGNTTLVTETDIAITGKFTDITFSDFEQLGIGENAFGYIKGYFKPSYTVSGTDYSVAVGDEIVRNSIVYRVVTILGTFELADTEIFVKTLLRRE